jgi:glycerol-3-phosphate O-acyltransferase / dihydroxyacetone phosphate acyltransferase
MHEVIHLTEATSAASLFKNPIVAKILLDSCNIPVDRKSKDRQKLLKGTIEALSKGVPVALFPEGTSYTEPRIMQVKDGAAWAALEYTKQSKESGRGDPVHVIPVAIVYTHKSKYRSRVSSVHYISFPPCSVIYHQVIVE